MATRKKRSRPGEDAARPQAAPVWQPGKGWTTAPAWTRDPSDPRNQAARELATCAGSWRGLSAARDGDGPERQAARVLRALVGALLTGDAAALARLNGAATWGFGRRADEPAPLERVGAPGSVVTTADQYPPKGSKRTPQLLGYTVNVIGCYLRKFGKRSWGAAWSTGQFLAVAAEQPGHPLREAILRHGGNPDAPDPDAVAAAVFSYLERTQRPTAEGALRCFVRLCGVSAKAATDILAVVG